MFSLPVQRRKLYKAEIPAFFPALRSQRSARLTRSGGSSPSGVRSQVTISFQGRLEIRRNRLSGQMAPICDVRRALWRRAGSSATDKAAFCRQRVQTGRRLMRQTVLPTMIHGRIAPTHSENSARRFASKGSRSAGRPGLRFGLPLTPESGGPSRRPAARYARTAIRAYRETRPPPSRV